MAAQFVCLKQKSFPGLKNSRVSDTVFTPEKNTIWQKTGSAITKTTGNFWVRGLKNQRLKEKMRWCRLTDSN